MKPHVDTRGMCLSSVQINALHKFERYRELQLCDDGSFRTPANRWWLMEARTVRQLVARDLVRMEHRNGATIAVWVAP